MQRTRESQPPQITHSTQLSTTQQFLTHITQAYGQGHLLSFSFSLSFGSHFTPQS